MNITLQQALQALEGIDGDLLIPIYIELYERTIHESSSEADRKKGKEIMAEVLSTASDLEKKQLIANLIAERPNILLEISEELERAEMSNKLLELRGTFD